MRISRVDVYDRIALSVIALSFALYSYVATEVFRSHPFSMDEYSYWYQSRIFSMGRLALPDDRPSGLLEVYMQWQSGFLFSKYPPGWALLLSLGQRLGIPALVAPLVSAATLWVTYRLCAVCAGKRWGLASVVILATNPYFVGYAASFFSHPLALALSTGALLLAVPELSARRAPPAQYRRFAIGLVVGALIWVRPLDALCVALAIAVVQAIAARREAIRRITEWGLVAAAMALAFMLYNAYLTGTVSVATYPIARSEFRVVADPQIGPVDNVLTIASEYVNRLFTGTLTLARDTLLKSALIAPLLAAAALLLRAAATTERRLRHLVMLHLSALVLLYNFHNTGSNHPTWPQYGMRYWYPAVGGLGALCGVGLKALYTRWRAHRPPGLRARTHVLAWVVACTVIVQLTCLSGDLSTYRERFEATRQIQEHIRQSCPGHRVVVLDCEATPSPALPAFVSPCDQHRNPIWERDRFVVRTLENGLRVHQRYPDYALCPYDFQGWQKPSL